VGVVDIVDILLLATVVFVVAGATAVLATVESVATVQPAAVNLLISFVLRLI